MNRVMLHGRMTSDVEIKVNSNGTEYCNFCIAVDKYMGKGKPKETDFINCKAYSKTAILLNTYFGKGKEIVCEGTLHFDKYEKDGENRFYSYVSINNVEFCGSGKSQIQTEESISKTSILNDTEDDDLPF